MKCINSSDVVKRLMLDFGESFEGFEVHVRSGELDLDKMIDGKIDEMLEQEDLIVEGRSGFMLFNNKDVFIVLLTATADSRAGHVAKRRGIEFEEARIAVRQSDEERAGMVKRLFNKQWLDPHNYHMTINTALVSLEAAADLITRAFSRMSTSDTVVG